MRAINKRTHSKRIFGFIVGGLVLLVLIGAFFMYPLPRYIEGPGEAVNLRSMVTVNNQPDHKSGQLLLTSVGIAQATPYSYLQTKFSPYLTLENINDVTGGESSQTYEQVQNFYMQSAINSAIYVSYRAAHRSVKLKNNGIYVLSKLSQSTFKKLQVGDIILKVDHHQYNSAQGYQKFIQSQSIGHRLTIQYLHDRHQYQTSAKLIRLPGTNRAGIGITLTDNLKVHTQLSVKINPGAIGGPSAGLMFSLQIYNQLTHQNLKRNRIIAGTGTIAPNGEVGEIGGIDKKVITARNQGAKIFLAPYIKPTKEILKLEPDHKTNYQLAKITAKKYAPHMKVIPVTSFSDALNKLNQ